ncbi:50s ribosomal protein l25 [Nannochloropsis oceanica]
MSRTGSSLVRRLGVSLTSTPSSTVTASNRRAITIVTAARRPPHQSQASPPPPSANPLLSTRCLITGSSRSGSSAADSNEGASKKYVSPHNWMALVRDYGKSDAVVGDAPMEIQTIQATARTPQETGSRYSQRAREKGHLPGVLYGPGVDGDKERHLITVERREIEKQMRRLGDSIASTVFDLQLGQYKQRVLIRDLDRDPGTALPIAVNFLRYRPGYPVEVPVCFVNEDLCLPLKRGGMLLSINRFIRVSCEGETLPEMLMVDMTGVRNNQKVGLERVHFPSNVQPYEVSESFVLGVVKGKNVAGTPGGPDSVADEVAATA